MKISTLCSVVLTAVCAFCLALTAQGQWPSSYANAVIPQDKLVQPEVLNKLLTDAKAAKPLVLQVGSRVLFAQAHIAGSEYVGPGSTPAGLAALEARVSKLPRTAPLVIYCGCCPWTHCPNLGPAFAKLQQMGFTRVQVLHIESNLGADWVAKGYKVDQGQ